MTRAVRFILLLLLALAAAEYFFSFLLINFNKKLAMRSKKLPLLVVLKTQRITNDLFIDNNTLSNAHQTYKIEVEFTNQDNVNKNVSQMKNITLSTTDQENSVNVGTPSFFKNIKEINNKLNKIEPLPLCASMPSNLGPVAANKTEIDIESVEKEYPEVQWGGRYSPSSCTARHKVAIIVPYRNRSQHLPIFLNHMHPFLMKQQIEYGIFIIEQEGDRAFNRAKLMNVGFMESQRLEPGGWRCFILHDIDLLPLDTRNMYSCPKQPRHMSSCIEKHNYISLYDDIFGGVAAVTTEQFMKINGFSNQYWGWGGEDMDIFRRLEKMNYHIARYKKSIARYATLGHETSEPNPKRFELLLHTPNMLQNDGLSSLEYELIQVVEYQLYTRVLANIDERK